MATFWRKAVVAAGVVFLALSPAGSALAAPPATETITIVPVGPGGEPINGYEEAPAQGNVAAVSDCTEASQSAVAEDVYSCAPSAAGAGTCWAATPGSLLCVDDPWSRQLRRVTYGGQLPPVRPRAIAEPLALLLDDGTRCRIRNGGAWGGRDDGYLPVYGCDGSGSPLAVLWLPGQGAGTWIDRSAPLWTVKVGQLGLPDQHFPPPQIRAVATAWFAGSSAPE